MCGFGMDMIFHIAVFLVILFGVIAMLKWAFGNWFGGISGGPYGGLIQIVIGVAVALVILTVLWRLAQCAGVLHGSLDFPLLG